MRPFHVLVHLWPVATVGVLPVGGPPSDRYLHRGMLVHSMVQLLGLSLLAMLLSGVSCASPAPSAADTLFARGDFAAARAAYAHALGRNPGDIQAMLGLARLDCYANQLDAAAESARKILALDPRSGPARRLTAIIAQRRAVLASAAAIQLPPGGITVPFLESEPLPLIRARIDGRTADLLVDTGAPDVTLDTEFARQLGLAIVRAGEGVFAGGRTARVRKATVHSIEVGPVVLHDLKVDILPSRGLRLFKGRLVDGIVGTLFLSRFLATIDYPDHRLVLQPRLAKISAGDAATVVPMYLIGDHFVFVTGSIDGLDGQLFLVDSGGAGAGFIPAASTITAAHIPLTSPSRRGIGGGGEVTLIPIVVDRLCVGSACRRRVPGTYTPGGSQLRIFPFRVAGIVTHLYLEHYRVTFDFAHMRLVLARS